MEVLPLQRHLTATFCGVSMVPRKQLSLILGVFPRCELAASSKGVDGLGTPKVDTGRVEPTNVDDLVFVTGL